MASRGKDSGYEGDEEAGGPRERADAERLLAESRPELRDEANLDRVLLGWEEIESYTIEQGDFRVRLPMPKRQRQILGREPWTYWVTPDTIASASEVPAGDAIRRGGWLYTLTNSLSAFWAPRKKVVAHKLAANFFKGKK